MLTGIELAALIASRELSTVEVVQAHLDRIEETKAINAVVALNERALAEARTAPRGPLHGVPFTVKDNVAAAGLPMAIGVPERAHVIAERDATVVARMKAAGAILLGKTNCPPWAGGIETDNPVYGRTRNPYDLDRTPGGSSGGEAAVIAAGGSTCGLGTDSGASIRLPAHFCGLAALKPTSGRVPLTGVLDDEGQLGTLGDPRTVVGPLARSVEDVALLFRLIAGPDGRDAGVAPVAPQPSPQTLRAAVFTDGAGAETTAAVNEAAAVLGATEAAPPAGGHELTIEVWRSYGGGMDALELYRLLRRWDAFRTAMLAFMERFDVLLTPVFPEPARRHGDMNRPGEPDPTGFTTPHSLTGAPAATVRCGTSSTGLPIGVQIVARRWCDGVALEAARRIEAALGGYTSPRSFSADPSACSPLESTHSTRSAS
jgi:amidase